MILIQWTSATVALRPGWIFRAATMQELCTYLLAGVLIGVLPKTLRSPSLLVREGSLHLILVPFDSA